MKYTLLFILINIVALQAAAQIKIGDNPKSISPASLLELESTNKGLLIPRIHRDSLLSSALNSAPNGMLIYQIEGDSLFIRQQNKWVCISNQNNIEQKNIYLFPEDFGANPNDANFDNSSAIQQAIDSALQCGKIVYFDQGDYYVQKTIYIRKRLSNNHDDGIKMVGAGISHTRIISKVNNNALIVMENTLYSNSKPIPGYFFKGGYIKNILFMGTGGKGNCFNITGWWAGLLENIQIQNFNGNGIHMPTQNNFGPPYDAFGNAYTDNYSSFISLKNSQIDNNEGWGYYDEKENTSSDLNCEKTVIASNGKGGIRFGGQSLRLVGCAIAYNGFGSNTGGGLELAVNGNSSHNNFITQNEFDANHQYHIKMNGVINNQIVSNRFLFHDLIDTSKMTPANGAILLASDSLYPYADNVTISNNYVRVDYPTKAFTNRQQLYFVRFLNHASSINIKIENNFFQALPTGFTKYHNFTRYDYYFDSRLGITNNIIIDDPNTGSYFNSARGALPPYFDGIIQNKSIDTISSTINLKFPITYGGYNILNLEEYVQFYDTTKNEFQIPESGYYEINASLGIQSNSASNNLKLEYYIDHALYSTHAYPVLTGSDSWVSDKLIIYCYKGLKLNIKLKASSAINFSVSEQSKVFIKMLR